MADGRIITLYTPFRFLPLRFVVHRRQPSGPELFELHRFLSLKELVKGALTILNSTRSDFLARIQELDDQAFQRSPHKMRRYIADRRDLLYINSPHLTDQHSTNILGCWVATNIGRKETSRIISFACQAAGIKRENLSTLKF